MNLHQKIETVSSVSAVESEEAEITAAKNVLAGAPARKADILANDGIVMA